jgi:hypothetical protein
MMSSNDQILAAAQAGFCLPPGDFWFTTPLVLTDLGLSGSPDGGTRLRALPSAYTGALVIWRTPLAQSDPELGLPRRRVLRDLRIVGNGPTDNCYGLLLDTVACGRVIRVDLVDCYLGLAIGWAVDVAFRDCVFRRNACNIYLPGSGANTITTLRFSGCHVREAYGTGVLIQSGVGVTFDDRTIIESNHGIGVVVDPTSTVSDIRLRDVWFENNGTNYLPSPYLTLDNCGLH